LSVDYVARGVHGKCSSVDDDPVREFVPVLVAQASRRPLASQRPARRRT